MVLYRTQFTHRCIIYFPFYIFDVCSFAEIFGVHILMQISKKHIKFRWRIIPKLDLWICIDFRIFIQCLFEISLLCLPKLVHFETVSLEFFWDDVFGLHKFAVMIWVWFVTRIQLCLTDTAYCSIHWKQCGWRRLSLLSCERRDRMHFGGLVWLSFKFFM